MKKRLITAGIGITVGIILISLFDIFAVLPITVSVIVAIIISELFAANKCATSKSITACCYIFAFFILFSGSPDFAFLFPYRSIVSLLGIFVIFASYINGHNDIQFEHIFFMIGSTLLITYSMSSLISIHTDEEHHLGQFYIVLTLCAAWLADSGAYFIGTFLGKHKLCPEISPKKTIEGFIGGILTNGLILMAISFAYYNFKLYTTPSFDIQFDYLKLFILGVICAILGTLGDLTASIIKRQCNIKDYGNIMPGHGGMLDRFDSVLFVAPFTNLFIEMFGIIK